MTDPLSVISASVGLGTFAFQSAKTLYDLLKSFHNYPDSVKHLQTELYGLVVALERVQNITCDDKVRAELDPILKACHMTCSGLRDVINKCTTHSGGRQPNFQDWMKMKFLGGDIDEFKETLVGYKSTITIIITSISIDLAQMNLHQLADYQSAIAETTSRLSAQLQNVGQRSPVQLEDQGQIKELEDTIRQCIQTCRKAGKSIDRVRRESLGEVTRGQKKNIAARKIQQKADEDLQHVQSFLSSSEIRLLEMKEQELARQQQQQLDERRCWLDHCRSILEARQEAAQQERAHRFKNISCQDQSLQIVISTAQNTVSAEDINAGTQSSQIMGDCPSSTAEKLIENHNHGSHRKESSPVSSRKLFRFFGRTSKKAPGYS